MSIDFINNSRSLTAGINAFETAPSFALKNIFKSVERHATDIIDWEEWSRSSKLASFVGDADEPVLSSKGTGKVYTVKIPKTSNMKLFTAKELATYKRLSEVGYVQNVQSRLTSQAQYIQDELKSEQLAVMRTREYLAMKLLVEGTVTVNGQLITMNYEANKQTFTLASGSKWTDTSVNPLTSLDTYKKTISKRSNATPNICIMGSTAAVAFLNNSLVMAALDTNNLRTGALDLTQGITEGSVNYLGHMRGMSFYEYIGTYDNAGSATDIMDPAKIVMLSTDDSFRLHHAPIEKVDGIFIDDIYVRTATDTYGNWKSWVIEQKSLPIVHNKSLVISATVV